MSISESIEVQEQDVSADNLSEWVFFWRKLFPVIMVCFAAKLLVSWRFPFTGDEAYLSLWGKYIAWGYYDHPPVLGWMLYLVQYVSDSYIILRLVPILVTTAVSFGVYVLLKSYDRRKAYLVFILIMVSPVNMAFFIVITDVPLMLFSFLSVFFMFKAERKGHLLFYLISGIFLGFAFLSKYFAVMLGFSYLVYILAFRKDIKGLLGLLVMACGAVPFVIQNVIWNYTMGWPNVMHNFFNRLESDTNTLLNLLSLAVFLLYIMTPPVLYFVFKNSRRLRDVLHLEGYRLFFVVSLLPLVVFFGASFVKGVRPHWYASFLPFAYLTAALFLDNSQMRKCIKFSVIFSLLQICLVAAVPFARIGELDELVDEGDRASFVAHLHPEKVVALFEAYSDRFVLATKSYSMSSLFEYYIGQRVIVFGKGSKHGRHDDILTNFKELKGSDIVVLLKKSKYKGDFDKCFERTHKDHFEVEGAPFTLVFGYGFKYKEYRKQYLRSIAKSYYRQPKWLGDSRCFFRKKYNFKLKR
jgi:hypothetical protein